MSVQVNTSVNNTEQTIIEEIMFYWYSLLEEEEQYFGAQNIEDVLLK